MIAPARAAAFTALGDVNARRHDLPAAIAAVRPTLNDERDRALAAELVTGTLRWQRQLDALIEYFSKRPTARLDFAVLQILRLGAYQLIHLDRVPASAAVNDAVALTKRAKKTSAAGLVNAVLRAIAANRTALPLPNETDPLSYLEISLSHPRWLAARWLRRLGLSAATERETFNNSAAPLTIRVNRLKASPLQVMEGLGQHGVEVVKARFAPDGFVVKSGNPLRTPLAGTGMFFLQDEASQLVPLLAAVRPGMRVLDACASPGGKTTAMAAAAEDRARIVAADLRSARMRLLRETVQSSGAASVSLLQTDLEFGLPFPQIFDVVFVDAPCSGLGTIRRDPDIRWRRQESDFAGLADAQGRMIRNAAQTVRPGGTLVYSTCSSEPEENDEVLARFLDDTPSFEAIDIRRQAGPHLAALEPVLDDRGFLRTLPERHGLEAFFGAALRRVK
ncbi:MAG: 16S rRNA (cytosine(967)-C(5))-methyltransferase RsmB [Vicinamibacterales bacterium]|nr:16S rRNA (cytosine(967)-C(5))-methyltransferase RsmB [Vicinamibacterales bacterium]